MVRRSRRASRTHHPANSLLSVCISVDLGEYISRRNLAGFDPQSDRQGGEPRQRRRHWRRQGRRRRGVAHGRPRVTCSEWRRLWHRRSVACRLGRGHGRGLGGWRGGARREGHATWPRQSMGEGLRSGGKAWFDCVGCARARLRRGSTGRREPTGPAPRGAARTFINVSSFVRGGSAQVQ